MRVPDAHSHPPRPSLTDSALELFRQWHATRDPALRERLILMHDPLVFHVAREYAHHGELLEDLVQVGRVGLVNAVDRFDPSRNTKFATFAVPTIKGEIRRWFRDKGWVIKVPRRLQELSLRVARCVDELCARLGRPPTYEEIAEATGHTVETIIEASELGQSYELLSLDASREDTEQAGLQLADRLGAADKAFERIGDSARLHAAIEHLNPREQAIIRWRYFEEMSQSEVAKRLGISQMHVSRLERRAILNMRRRLLSDEPDGEWTGGQEGR
jgi:RNA polymerase sigma-B factor